MSFNYGGTKYWLQPDANGNIFVSNICEVGSLVVQINADGTLIRPYTSTANKNADLTAAELSAGSSVFNFKPLNAADTQTSFTYDSNNYLVWFNQLFSGGQVQFIFNATPSCVLPYVTAVYSASVTLPTGYVPINLRLIPYGVSTGEAAAGTLPLNLICFPNQSILVMLLTLQQQAVLSPQQV